MQHLQLNNCADAICTIATDTSSYHLLKSSGDIKQMSISFLCLSRRTNVDVHRKSNFFRAHRYVGNEMAKLREQEEQMKS